MPPPPPPNPFERKLESRPGSGIFPDSAVLQRRSSGSSGVGASLGGGGFGGHGSAGDSSAPSASANLSENNLGARGTGSWLGGVGEESAGLGVGRATLAGMDAVIVASPPPRLDPSLMARLEVVDYVLRRPFSDETLRNLFEAIAADHRRVRVDDMSSRWCAAPRMNFRYFSTQYPEQVFLLCGLLWCLGLTFLNLVVHERRASVFLA